MKKFFLLFLLIPFLSQCNDDDDKDNSEVNLPADFFYQTVWEGKISGYFNSFGNVIFQFETDSTTLVTGMDDKGEYHRWTFDYYLENKILKIYLKNTIYGGSPTGTWMLIYSNHTMDSLVFKTDIRTDQESTLQLKKVPLE